MGCVDKINSRFFTNFSQAKRPQCPQNKRSAPNKGSQSPAKLAAIGASGLPDRTEPAVHNAPDRRRDTPDRLGLRFVALQSS
jgi:hypothetical protein